MHRFVYLRRFAALCKRIPSTASVVLISACAIGCGESTSGDPDAGPGLSGAFGLNDVSILLPLPESPEDPGVLRLDTLGKGGPLLAEALFEQVDLVAADIRGEPMAPEAYSRWGVVGVRIDPCFPDLALLATDPRECWPQLRLVAQPIARASDDGRTIALDRSLHLLFDLEGSQFSALAQGWGALRDLRPEALDLPLGVSPVMRSEGLSGTYALALRALLVEHVGTANLAQVAAMRGNTLSWEFGMFVVDGELLQASAIAKLSDAGDVTSQFISTLLPQDSISIQPASAIDDALMPLSGSPAGEVGGEWMLTETASSVEQALQLTLDLDNPETEHHAESVDCVACHASTRLRERAVAIGGASEADLRPFASPNFNLELDNIEAVRNSGAVLRSFGYFDDQVAVSQRTINESAKVAEALQDD